MTKEEIKINSIVISIGDFRKKIKKVLDFIAFKRFSVYIRKHKEIICVLIPPVFSSEDMEDSENEIINISDFRNNLRFFIDKVSEQKQEENRKWFHISRKNTIIATFGKNKYYPDNLIEWNDFNSKGVKENA